MIAAAVLLSVLAQAPATYDAVTDRGPRAKPALITLGPGGFSFNDPVFGSHLWRITDRFTRTDSPDASFRTPSATHQNEWSANGSFFYVVSTDGTVVPFRFDRRLGTATTLPPLRFYIEPQFSFVSDSVIYGSVSGGTLHTIDQYDFSSRKYTQLLDLEKLEPGLQNTYVGGISSSAGPAERIMAFFGGVSQDRHHYIVVFDRNAPAERRILDTATLGFNLHHASIDRSGRFVLLYPASADLAPPRRAAQVYVWDTVTNTTTALPLEGAHSGGHDAYGFGVIVNQDCCTSTQWDAAQWQIRSLASPLETRDLITPTMAPKEVYLADHPTWNNARPDHLVPFVTATYRYGDNTVDWRPWDDEILAVQTDAADGHGAEVFRLAHHRSNVRDDNDPTRISFWYTPRPNVSHDGQWVLFTSNWEKTLGTDPHGARGETARQDVFLLRLTSVDSEEPSPVRHPCLRQPGCS
jgi:hypothetical protein